MVTSHSTPAGLSP
ncbi:hypothetical protein D047_1559A, partial [Vibrio parahaemolyticus VPTS-2010_2]